MTMSGVLHWEPAARARRSEPATRRPWLVLHDPSGDFKGSRLRAEDVSLHLAVQPWPDGMIVWHERCGEVRIWREQDRKWGILTPKKR